MNADQVVAAYLALRKKKEDLKAEQAAAMAPINDQMNKCLAWIQRNLQQQGLTNCKGESGIAFLQTDTNVTVKDWDAMFAWIQEKNLWQFLDRRVSKSVVQEYIAAYQQIPPGLHVTTEISTHVRKG